MSLDDFCRDNGIRYCNPFLYKYKKDYPNLELMKESWFKKNALFFSHLKKIGLAKIINFDRDKQYSSRFYDPQFYRNILMYCWGWGFRDWNIVAKYHENYKKQFYPNEENLKITNSILNIRKQDQKLLGVHIKRGDYVSFENGKYYYGDQTYIAFIEQMQNLIGNNCKIILFSNDEKLNPELYKISFSDIYISEYSVAVDHYPMSQCDFLLGPPSIFTIWASFIGDGKCFHIENKDQKLKLDQFKVFD